MERHFLGVCGWIHATEQRDQLTDIANAVRNLRDTKEVDVPSPKRTNGDSCVLKSKLWMWYAFRIEAYWTVIHIKRVGSVCQPQRCGTIPVTTTVDSYFRFPCLSRNRFLVPHVHFQHSVCSYSLMSEAICSSETSSSERLYRIASPERLWGTPTSHCSEGLCRQVQLWMKTSHSKLSFTWRPWQRDLCSVLARQLSRIRTLSNDHYDMTVLEACSCLTGEVSPSILHIPHVYCRVHKSTPEDPDLSSYLRDIDTICRRSMPQKTWKLWQAELSSIF
jgi:hypothetical protein